MTDASGAVSIRLTYLGNLGQPGIGYPTLAEGGLAVRAGALFVGTNADSTLPGPRGIQPGNGSLLQVIAYATGAAPVIAGKPEPPLHRESVIRTGARNPLVVGDRLDTDIDGARRAGMDSMLVLTGVSSPADLLAAPKHRRPTFVAADLSGLFRPAGESRVPLDTADAGGWRVTRDGESATLAGDGDPVVALRLLCGVTWDGVPVSGLRAGSPAVETGWLALRAELACPEWTELVDALEREAVSA